MMDRRDCRQVRGLLFAAALGALLIAGTGAGAQDTGQQLSAAMDQFESGAWPESMASLEALLAGGGLSPAERITIHKYLGIGYALVRKEEERAVGAFKELLSENPDFDVRDLALRFEEKPSDPVKRLFLQASYEWNQERRQRRRELMERTTRPGAIARSLLLPGLGQRYEGYRGRSWAMVGLTSASVAYAVLADRSFRRARDVYDEAAIDAEFVALWDDYSKKADRADLAMGVVGAVWALSLVDVALSGPNLSGLEALEVGPTDSPGGVQLAWRVEF